MNFKPNIGDIFLNKYKIVSLVGEGSFGSVYRALDTKLERIVAIKFINASGNTIERFTDELDAIKNLDHPNIVRLYDYDILRGGIPCIVMEFVNGREIGDILAQKGPFEPLRICEIAKQVLDALVETHKNGIIHCDLKPENIMLTSLGARSDVVKLIDFGVASILTKTADSEERSKLLVGTPQYMAPEQITHGEIGPWTDTYALGLILIELFTGQFVFDHDDPREVLKMQLYTPVVLPHELACTELGTIIAKATQKDISRRYRSTQQFYNDLCDAMQAMQSNAKPQPMMRSNSRRWTKNTGSLIDDLSDFGIVADKRRVRSTMHEARTQMHDSDMILKSIMSSSSDNNPSLEKTRFRMDSQKDINEITTIPGLVQGKGGDFSVPLMTSESIAGMKSPIRDLKEQPETTLESVPVLQIPELKKPSEDAVKPVEKAESPAPEPIEAPDLSALQSSLGVLSLEQIGDIANSAPEAPAEPPVSIKDDSVMPPAVSEIPRETTANLSPEAAKMQSMPATHLPMQKKKNPLAGVVVVCFILIAVLGGGYYAMKAGFLDSIMKTSDAPAPAKTADVKSVETDNPAIVRFSTLQDASKKMAYVAAISGHAGAIVNPSAIRTFRVTGSPTSASIYVNDSLVCYKTPCSVRVYGDTALAKLEIRKDSKSKAVDISNHDPKTPVIMVLGE